MQKPKIGAAMECITSLVPDREISNDFRSQESALPLAQIENVFKVTGVRSRRAWNQSSYDPLAICQRICEETITDVNPADIGMLYFNTAFLINPKFRLVPTPAEDLKMRLGLPEAGTISASGGCGSFSGLLCEAIQYVMCHGRKALIVGIENSAEYAKSGIPQLIFGDACVAILLRPSEDLDKGFVSFKNAVSILDAQGKKAAQEMNDALIIKKHDEQYGDYSLMMKGRTVGRFVSGGVTQTLRKFLTENKVATEELDVLVPHQANLTIMNEIRSAFMPGKEMVVTVDSRGNNAGLSCSLALHKGLNDHKGTPKKFLLCAFGSGPSVTCAVYHSSGTEKVVTLGEAEQKPQISPTPKGHAPFVILNATDFDQYAGRGYKLLAKAPLDVKVLSMALDNECEVLSSDLLQKGTDDDARFDISFNRKVILAALSRIPVQNELVKNTSLAWNAGDRPGERLEKHLVHKMSSANVLLSKFFRMGNLFHFNMFTETEEIRFDHPSAHIQGMLLMEAARQTTIATLHLQGLEADGIVIAEDLGLAFHKFMDSDKPIVIRSFTLPVRVTEGEGLKTAVAIQITQKGQICASGFPIVRCLSGADARELKGAA